MKNKPGTFLFILLIRAYRYFISPLMGNNCRFYPSCSNYCEQAINDFGLLKGSFLSIKRLGKCHPFHNGGYDPVPENQTCCQHKEVN